MLPADWEIWTEQTSWDFYELMLLEVELEHQVHNPLHALPFIGAIPRYFVSAEHSITRLPVTLDPYTTTARFPIIATRDQNLRLVFETFSLLPGAWYDVRAVRVSAIPITQHKKNWLVNLFEQEKARQPMGPGADKTGRY